MSPIIPIAERSIGAASIATVNARQLHAFLEVGKDFSTWIKDRIEQYSFIEGVDYVEVFPEIGENLQDGTPPSPGEGMREGFTQNPVKPKIGRPAKDYALSLDMAKELSMVERNDKGKQARRYFIACERQARAGVVAALAPSKAATEAAKVFSANFRVMRLIGLDKNAAAISANQSTQKIIGLSLLALNGQTHLAAANQTSLYYTPTELGQQMGGLSAKKVNLLLAATASRPGLLPLAGHRQKARQRRARAATQMERNRHPFAGQGGAGRMKAAPLPHSSPPPVRVFFVHPTPERRAFHEPHRAIRILAAPLQL